MRNAQHKIVAFLIAVLIITLACTCNETCKTRVMRECIEFGATYETCQEMVKLTCED